MARTDGKGRFCSKRCSGTAPRGSGTSPDIHSYQDAVCEQCGKDFKSRIDSFGRFCSRQCSARWHGGTRNPMHKGGLSFAKKANRWSIVCRDGSLVLFARAVVEAELGRPLRSDEIVHHIDRDKTNDDPANLEVTTRADHVRLHQEAGEIPTIQEVLAR